MKQRLCQITESFGILNLFHALILRGTDNPSELINIAGELAERHWCYGYSMFVLRPVCFILHWCLSF